MSRINDYTRELRNISINEKNINYPVEVDNRVYKKIINQNDFTFNVYSYDYNNDKFMLYPLFITEQPKSKHVNLLYFTEESEESINEDNDSIYEESKNEVNESIYDIKSHYDRKSHYAVIKYIDKLLSRNTNINDKIIIFCS